MCVCVCVCVCECEREREKEYDMVERMKIDHKEHLWESND